MRIPKITGYFLLFALFALTSFGQTEKKTVIQDLCWAPDGNSLYFSAMRVNVDFSDYKPEKWSIYRYERDTGKVIRIVSAAYTVTVSPDGEQIAVGKVLLSGRDIYIADKDGKNLKRLTKHEADDSAPSWSPDGRRIAFNSKRSGHVEIHIIRTDGTGLSQITKSEHKSYNPSWSPDGKTIAFYLEKGDGKDQIHTIVPGGKPVRQTNDEFNNIYPGWIDNKTIVYGQGQRGRIAQAFTVSTESGEKEQILAIDSFFARYSPDGSMIAYVDEIGESIQIVDSSGTGLFVIVIPQN